MRTLFLLPGTGELCIMDDLSTQKLLDYCNSPYIQARSTFWEDQVELFPAFETYNPCFYWQHGPILALPERAQSLVDWSHCMFCGYPLDNPSFDDNCIDLLIEETPIDSADFNSNLPVPEYHYTGTVTVWTEQGIEIL